MLMSGSGYEYDEFEGSGVEGDDVLGDDVLGELALVGAKAKAALARRGVQTAIRRPRPQKPAWRQRLAPGVPMPGYGVYPVPLTPLTASGIFAVGVTNIQYQARPQFAFQPERLVVTVTRTGTTALAAQVLAQNGLHVGVRPQIGVLGNLNLETFTKDAFGVRLICEPTEPGGELNIFALVSPVVSGTDTLKLSIDVLGSVAR